MKHLSSKRSVNDFVSYSVDLRDDNAASYVQNLSKLLDHDRPQIVLCLVQGNKPDRYNAIKKVCYIDRGGNWPACLEY